MAGTTHLGGGGPAGDISFNYVPLIDVTFNMIIFFVLTSEIATATLSRVLVPSPLESQAVRRGNSGNNNVVIAILSTAADQKNVDPEMAARAGRYEIDGKVIPMKDLTENLIKEIKARREAYKQMLGATGSEEFFVEIRADLRVNFAEVQPVIEAVAAAGVPKMAISVHREG